MLLYCSVIILSFLFCEFPFIFHSASFPSFFRLTYSAFFHYSLWDIPFIVSFMTFISFFTLWFSLIFSAAFVSCFPLWLSFYFPFETCLISSWLSFHSPLWHFYILLSVTFFSLIVIFWGLSYIFSSGLVFISLFMCNFSLIFSTII